MRDRGTLTRNLLKDYPEKAFELLFDYLKDDKIRTDAEQYIGQQSPSLTRLDAASEELPRSSQTHSHRPEFPPLQRTTRQNITGARHGLHTPSTSAGSVKSRPSSLAAAGLEKIIIMSCDDDGADQPVMSRCAAVKHNLVGDKVVYGRNLGVSPDLVDELVFVPHPTRGPRWEKVTRAVSLTWRRPKEFTTNVDTFYIIPATLLDCDMILGSDESLERQFPSDVQEAPSPQARYQRGFVEMEELNPAVPPPAPTVPMCPDQQTSMPLSVRQTYDRMQAFRDIQRTNAAEPSTPTPHPRHTDHEQPTHTTTPLAAQEPSRDQLQVISLWDRTPLKLSFDPGASGEAFYQAFHQWAERRKRGGDIERHKMTLWLKTSKSTPDEEAYDLSMKDSELEELWETAVDWMQENKSPKAPHLYAKVELEAG